MNNIKILILLCLFVTVNSFSQQKKYVSYTIKEGESIRSIAKDLDISTRDLLRLNPDVGRKPDAETVIIIPNKNYNESIISTKNNVEKQADHTKEYEVQPKETLYGISKKFDISISELISANPGLENGLKIGMKLKIPSNEPVKTDEDDDFVLHTVVKDNTVYNITKRYHISEEELNKLNPALAEGLKLGMVLKIRKSNSEIKNDSNGNEEDIAANNSNWGLGGTYFKENIKPNKQVNVVFVLPYQLNKVNDSIVKGGFFGKSSLTSIAADFHLGAQMAIDSLKLKGVSVSAKFLDSDNSVYKLQSLVNKGSFNSADVVIGPLFFDKAEWLSKHVKTPIITPFFSKNQDSYSASNLIKGYPKQEYGMDKLLNHLEVSYKNENVIIINDGKEVSQSKLWKVYNNLKTIPGMKEITVIKPESSYIAGGRISGKMSSLSKNWVFLITEDNVITASAMNNLKSLADKFEISVIALDKGKNFDNIDNFVLGSLNFMYPSVEFYNMSSKNNKVFFEKYQAKNFAVPSDYAIKGFDITYDTLIRLASTSSVDDAFTSGKSIRVASVYNYAKKMFGSTENKGVFIVQYSKELVPTIIP